MISIVHSRCHSSVSGNRELLDGKVGGKNDKVNFLEVASSEHTSTSAQFLEEYQVPRCPERSITNLVSEEYEAFRTLMI